MWYSLTPAWYFHFKVAVPSWLSTATRPDGAAGTATPDATGLVATLVVAVGASGLQAVSREAPTARPTRTARPLRLRTVTVSGRESVLWYNRISLFGSDAPSWRGESRLASLSGSARSRRHLTHSARME